MAGPAQIGFHVNDVPFGKQSLPGPAKKAPLHVPGTESDPGRRRTGALREQTDGLWKVLVFSGAEFFGDGMELCGPVSLASSW